MENNNVTVTIRKVEGKMTIEKYVQIDNAAEAKELIQAVTKGMELTDDITIRSWIGNDLHERVQYSTYHYNDECELFLYDKEYNNKKYMFVDSVECLKYIKKNMIDFAKSFLN